VIYPWVFKFYEWQALSSTHWNSDCVIAILFLLVACVKIMQQSSLHCIFFWNVVLWIFLEFLALCVRSFFKSMHQCCYFDICMCEVNALKHLTLCSQFKVLFCNLTLQFCFMTLCCKIVICLVMPLAFSTSNLVLHSMPSIVIMFLHIQIVIFLACFVFFLS